MFDIKRLQRQLLNLVGFEPNYDQTASDQLSYLTNPDSGIFVNHISPYLTFENILSVAPTFNTLNINAWNVATFYNYGDLVRDTLGDGSIYKYINDTSVDGQTVDKTTHWRQVTLITDWIERRIQAAIIRVVNEWKSTKFSKRTTKSLLETRRMFRGGNSIVASRTLTGHSGLEISPRKSKTISVKIHSAVLCYTSTGSVTLRLFKYGSDEEIQSQAVTIDTANVEQTVSLDWTIKGDGVYCIVADTDLVGVNAATHYDYANSGLSYYPGAKHVRIVSFDSNDADGSGLHDISNHDYYTDDNYGMNLNYSVYCDYTDLMIDQKLLFAEPLAYALAIDLINQLAANANQRINQSEARLDYDELKFELVGDNQRNRDFSLTDLFYKSIKGIEFDTSEVDKVCLPRKNYGIKLRSV